MAMNVKSRMIDIANINMVGRTSSDEQSFETTLISWYNEIEEGEY